MGIIIVLVIVLSSHVESARFELGDPTYFGSGCPSGTVEVVPASNGKSWSVLFSDFIAETEDDNLFDRKACNLAVPVDVEAGKRIGIYKTEYRGFTYGPSYRSTSSSSFHAEWFFAGETGLEEDKDYNSDRDAFYLAQTIDDDDVQYCECGASTIFRINTSNSAKKEKSSHDEVMIGIDSVEQLFDQSSSSKQCYKYYIKVESC